MKFRTRVIRAYNTPVHVVTRHTIVHSTAAEDVSLILDLCNYVDTLHKENAHVSRTDG